MMMLTFIYWRSQCGVYYDAAEFTAAMLLGVELKSYPRWQLWQNTEQLLANLVCCLSYRRQAGNAMPTE